MNERPTILGPWIRREFPWQDWQRVDQDCQAVLEIFKGPSPKSLVRIGDGEVPILESKEVPGLADSAKYADCVGICMDNRQEKFRSGEEMNTNEKNGLRALNILEVCYDIMVNPQILINANLFLLSPQLIGQLGKSKRLLWITSGADQIVRNMDSSAFRDYYELHDVADNSWINCEPGRCARPEKVTVTQSYKDIQRQLDKAPDFDLALVGAGVVGKLVCHYIKHNFEKSAVDVGAIMSALQGLRNRDFFQRGARRDCYVWDSES